MERRERVKIEIQGIDKFSSVFNKLTKSVERIERHLNKVNHQLNKLVSNFKKFDFIFNKSFLNRDDIKQDIRLLGEYAKAFDLIKQKAGKFKLSDSLPKEQRQEYQIKKKWRKDDLQVSKINVSGELSRLYANLHNVDLVDLVFTKNKILRFKKKLNELLKEGVINQKEYEKELARIINRYQTLYELVLNKQSKFISWWKRFGEVAVGFTIVYRAFLLIESAIALWLNY
jgi:hypothetical protein